MLELDGPTLSFEEFRELCLKPNRPAIIRHAVPIVEGEVNNLSDSVPREKKKFSSSFPFFFPVLSDLCERLSPEGLIRTFGSDHSVPVTETLFCGSAGKDEPSDENFMRCRDMSLGEVLEHWRSGRSALYLKDWHMQSDLESLASSREMRESETTTQRQWDIHGDRMYEVPPFLGTDWMDRFCRQRSSAFRGFGDEKSDYRFAYIGPPSTWTPLHFDVFGTYSWSLNICGEKMWYFPLTSDGNLTLLQSGLYGCALPSDIRVTAGAEIVGVRQRPGDLVFVPSCYLHQVHNIRGRRFALPARGGGGEVCLVMSVNHNWCNEWCVERMVEAFCRDANRVRRLLTEEDRVALFGDDLCAWHKHVEQMLRSGANWNFGSVRDFLQYIWESYVHGDKCNDNGTDGKAIVELLERCLGVVNAAELRVTGVSTSLCLNKNSKTNNSSCVV